MYMCSGRADAGHGCPITMTFAAVPALRTTPELPTSGSRSSRAPGYEPELGADKRTAKCGMAMTEKQGGSDVRSNATTARPRAATSTC